MAVVTGVDVEALKDAAEAATPGPWVTTYDYYDGPMWQVRQAARADAVEGAIADFFDPETRWQLPNQEADAAFVALANPAAVLALITALQDAQAANERMYRNWMACFDAARSAEAERDGLQRQVDAVRAERAKHRDDGSGECDDCGHPWWRRRGGCIVAQCIDRALTAAAAPTEGQEDGNG